MCGEDEEGEEGDRETYMSQGFRTIGYRMWHAAWTAVGRIAVKMVIRYPTGTKEDAMIEIPML